MSTPPSIVLPTTLSAPTVPKAPTPAPVPQVAVAAPAPALAQDMLTPEQINDLRAKVLSGEPVDRELLRRARDQLRQRNSMAFMGVKKAKDADDLAGAVNSGVLDF